MKDSYVGWGRNVGLDLNGYVMGRVNVNERLTEQGPSRGGRGEEERSQRRRMVAHKQMPSKTEVTGIQGKWE